MPHPDGCPTIDELHRTYNGPIPKHLRDAANAGGYLRHSLIQAKAQIRFWETQVKDWGANLRYQRRLARMRGAIGNTSERTAKYLFDARQRYRQAKKHHADVIALIAHREAERAASEVKSLDPKTDGEVIQRRLDHAMRVMFPVSE